MATIGGEPRGAQAPMKWRECLLWALFGLLWLGALGVGARVLWKFETTPGAAAAVQAWWPPASRLDRKSVV